MGLYLESFDGSQFVAPDDEDVQKFWKFTRGTPEDPSQRRPAHWVRAVFEVPESYGYNVSAIKDLYGHKINWGSQLADAIQIKLIGQAAEIGKHLGQKRRCKAPQPPPVAPVTTTRNFLTFVNTTAIAYGQKIAQSLKILVLCNSSRVYKRQKITSIEVVGMSATAEVGEDQTPADLKGIEAQGYACY